MIPCATGKHSMVWLSGVHLYLDFILTMNVRGPLYVGRKWVDVGSVISTQMLPDFLKRTHTFVRLVAQLWSNSEFTVPIRHTRPVGSAIVRRFHCYRLRWDPVRVGVIDRAILDHLGEQMVSLHDIRSCGDFVGHPEWALD